jgi:hypothetical protein
LPFLAFAISTNSLTLFTGLSERTTSSVLLRTTSVTGAKSRSVS